MLNNYSHVIRHTIISLTLKWTNSWQLRNSVIRQFIYKLWKLQTMIIFMFTIFVLILFEMFSYQHILNVLTRTLIKSCAWLILLICQIRHTFLTYRYIKYSFFESSKRVSCTFFTGWKMLTFKIRKHEIAHHV